MGFFFLYSIVTDNFIWWYMVEWGGVERTERRENSIYSQFIFSVDNFWSWSWIKIGHPEIANQWNWNCWRETTTKLKWKRKRERTKKKKANICNRRNWTIACDLIHGSWLKKTIKISQPANYKRDQMKNLSFFALSLSPFSSSVW